MKEIVSKHQLFFWLPVIILFALLLQNCATTNDVTNNRLIQKRKYLKGYHISKANISYTLNNIKDSEKELPSKNISTGTKVQDIITSKAQEFTMNTQYNHHYEKVNAEENLKRNTHKKGKPKIFSNDCDVIVKKNGEELLAKVLEISASEIRYKMCDNLTGPTIVLKIMEVSVIKYPNGTKTVFNQSENSSTVEGKTYEEVFESGSPFSTIDGEDKSFGLAIALWVILGLLGIHRFYLGYTAVGILYLLTFGLCGIGWIIDGILLVTGNLKPRKGNYIDT